MKTLLLIPILIAIGCNGGHQAPPAEPPTPPNPSPGRIELVDANVPSQITYGQPRDATFDVFNAGGSSTSAAIKYRWDGWDYGSSTVTVSPGETVRAVRRLPGNTRVETSPTPSDYHTLEVNINGELRSFVIEYPVLVLKGRS